MQNKNVNVHMISGVTNETKTQVTQPGQRQNNNDTSKSKNV